MAEGYDAEQRRSLERMIASGAALACPVCGGDVTCQRVDAAGQVSYVRRRVLLICTSCRRTAAVDDRSAARD